MRVKIKVLNRKHYFKWTHSQIMRLTNLKILIKEGGFILYQFIWYWKLKLKLATGTDTGLFGEEEILLVRTY
jgi:hypothetical protein